MGAKFIHVKFPTTEHAIVDALWKQYCDMMRWHTSVMSAVRQTHEFDLKLRVPPPSHHNVLLEDLGDVYRAVGKRWVLIPYKKLVEDVSMFQDAWTYGGIPWSCGDKFDYIPLPSLRSEKAVIKELMQGETCSLRAIQYKGCTYIGGWVPW